MKYFYFLLLFSTFCIAKAQENSEILVNHNWRLLDFDNECFGFGPIENGEFDPNNILVGFSNENGVIHFQTEMCQKITGIVEMTESELNFAITNIEGEECTNPLNQNYEEGFQCAMGGYYNYEITQENGYYKLMVANDIFMGAVFTTELLNIDEVSKNKISISPNPVKNNLTIENHDLKINHISITDANGKIWFRKSISDRKVELDLHSLPKGIYFINFESAGKKIQTEKIIKN